jgi:putative DNA primase/helicase
LPYDFDPDFRSQEAEDYIASTFNGDKETIQLVKQWFGYNLVPDRTKEKMMLFTGPPRSGKGTILAMLTGILGDQWCSSDICNLSQEFGREKMLGKLAVIIGETRSADSRKMSAALATLLDIVGGGDVNVNRKNRRELGSVKLPCRFTLAANDFPDFTDHTRALLSRLNVVVFPNTYAGREDYDLKPRMEEIAKSGALTNWALEGLKDLRTRKRFVRPVASMAALKEAEEVTVPVVAFVRECCAFTKDAEVLANELFDIWCAWCKRNGHNHGSQHKFGRWIANSYRDTITHMRQRIDGSRQYFYTGVTPTKEARDTYLDKQV